MKLIYGIADEYPDYSQMTDPSVPCCDATWPNLIFSATAGRVESPTLTGPLSIKTAFRGREIYETSEGRFVVDGSSYLILREGTSYSYLAEPDECGGTESLSVFFQTGFPENLFRDHTATEEELLDEPTGSSGNQSLPIIEVVHRHDQTLTPFLVEFRNRIRRGDLVDQLWLAERFQDVFGALLRVNGPVLHELRGISGARLSTRVERLRRLRRARDFMQDNFREPLKLEEIASAAALSPYHFLRSFREAFGLTPHQYLTACRLERAQQLLRETDIPISSICYDVGFDSPSSFSTLFRRSVGTSPIRYRAA